jgi:putative DNA methylase
MTLPYRKKLIEVALPLDAINVASAREKSIRHGHPSTMHVWWARRPLAAARAVIFAQMVDDPSSHPDIFRTEKAQEKERQRLFRIIEDLVKWENTTNEQVLGQARAEIWQSWRAACADNADHPRAKEIFNRHKLPAFHDPFAGGGALPLEAQRLGLESYASDLNPVAVLINRAMIEIPPKFAGKPPVNPEARSKRDLIAREWHGAEGLAEDVKHYGQWMCIEAEKRIGHLYPKVEITPEMARERPDLRHSVGTKLTVIAWLWTRTVRSPNPAFSDIEVPLVSSFSVSTKKGKEAWVDPVIRPDKKGYDFVVRMGGEPAIEETVNRRGGVCLMSGTPMSFPYIRDEGKAGRMKYRLMAVVAEGDAGRVYLSPTDVLEAVERNASAAWKPENALPFNPRDFKTPNYGLTTFADLFTTRQLVTLGALTDLAQEVRERVKGDCLAVGIPLEQTLADGGTGAEAYSDAIGTYLAMAVSKETVFLVTQARWRAGEGKSAPAFGRQALPMVWDFADINPFAGAGGDFLGIIDGTVKALLKLPAQLAGRASQEDAAQQSLSADRVVSTDPPYYDNIGYADLSDFFYVWLRRSLRAVYPNLFATVAVPKSEELVATPYRHGGKEEAEQFFLNGMTRAMHRLTELAHPAFPITIYYAFKQSETETEAGTASTGWETFLDAVIHAGFAINGTWPMRTENDTRLVGMSSNALASSIVLVCRPRETNAPTVTRRDFLAVLKAELPLALSHLQRGNIAPVDLAQAAIGPGMAVYSRYAKVVDADGNALSVRQALTTINEILDAVLAEQEGDFDADTRWALAWFEQFGFTEGEYGIAETLSKAKNTSVSGMVDAGILASKGGKVHLLPPHELPANWDPSTDSRLTVWEMVHHLIRTMSQGESTAAALLAKLGTKAEVARELAYRLFALCERKKRANEALAYNTLVLSWPEILRLARQTPMAAQTGLFEEI